MYAKHSIERDIAVSLVKVYRRFFIDYRYDTSAQELQPKTQMMAKQAVEGKAEELQNLIQFIRKESGDFLTISESEVPPNITKEERKGLDEHNNGVRLLRDATDDQLLHGIDISRPYLERMITKYG